MLDMVLFYNLVKALRPGAHLLLVGDADQLPSVGPGNMLRDLIASGAVPVARLRELFRQARRSRIVTAAHQINAGAMPDLANNRDGDLFFLRRTIPRQRRDTDLRPGGGADPGPLRLRSAHRYPGDQPDAPRRARGGRPSTSACRRA